METTLSERARTIAPSITLVISAKAKAMRAEGIDVLNFSAGEPDFDTPEVIKHALHNIFQALLDPGDEVVIPSPYWLSYPDMVKLSGGTPVILNAFIEDDFKISAEALSEAITTRTKLLILNSPSNPTGAVYSPEELGALAKVIEAFRKSFEKRRDILVEGLAAIDGIKAFKPAGAFYLFVDVSALYERLAGVTNSVEFCDYLLEDLRIACIPGKAFGEDRCIRFSFVTDEATIRKGLERLSEI